MDKKELIRSIQKVVDILVQKEYVKDPSPVSRLSSTNDDCKFDALEFSINKIPPHLNHNCDRLRILLGAFIKDNSKESSNPFFDYNFIFNVSILGDEIHGRTVINCFHIDYDDGSKSSYIHPLYHLTFGGMGLDGYNVGNFLNIPSPRFPILPMDVILIIDFILSSFLDKKDYANITTNSIYSDELRKSQTNYWKPYFQNIGIKWATTFNLKGKNILAFESKFNDSNFRKRILPTLID
ncbi:MAG: hypothetical protein K5860_11105 [Bacteroidales bacterium]|nr:hypothetical protein [Bacteroidales bacterium]